MNLQAPISYKGSKRQELKYIKLYEPKQFKKIVDVFGGGGSVFLYYMQEYKLSEQTAHYNDINPTLVQLFTFLHNENDINYLLAQLKLLPINEETVKAIYDRKPPYDKVQEIYRMLYLNLNAKIGTKCWISVNKPTDHTNFQIRILNYLTNSEIIHLYFRQCNR